MPFKDALAALGSEGAIGRHDDEIPLDAVIGSVARSEEYDATFKRRRRDHRTRRAEAQLRRGQLPPPIEVVQLGDLYFVTDGHHRVAAAKRQGWTSLPARVQRICTVAYARCCLRLADLNRTRAERRFRETVPLPEPLAAEIDFDSPADWAMLTSSAERWAAIAGSDHECCSHDFATAWWEAEVKPLIENLRAGRGSLDAETLQQVVTALGERDGLGSHGADSARAHSCCCAPSTSPR